MWDTLAEQYSRQLNCNNSFSLTFPWFFLFSLTFPWPLFNSLTFPRIPGFPEEWPPCIIHYYAQSTLQQSKMQNILKPRNSRQQALLPANLFHRDVEHWSFDVKMWSNHLCPTVHHWCEFGKTLSSTFLDNNNTPCLKKTVQTYFCQKFVKFRPIVKIFGTKIANRTGFSEIYSFSTSPNLHQYSRHYRVKLRCSKFDQVLTKN